MILFEDKLTAVLESIILETDDWWEGMLNIVKAAYPSDTSIYDQLTLRDRRSVLQQQYSQSGLKDKEAEYKQVVSNLASELTKKGFIVSKRSWVHVEVPYLKSFATNYDQASVQAFKAYRTFVPSQSNRVTTFLASLSGFADKLKELQESDPKNPDQIQFKFPGDLSMMFEHADTLVVHWRNKYNRQKINSLIDQYFGQVGLKFSDRGHRAQDGYDMKLAGKYTGGSHTQLISQALDKLLEATPQYRKLSDPQLKQWLQQWIGYFSKLSPQDMQAYLNPAQTQAQAQTTSQNRPGGPASQSPMTRQEMQAYQSYRK